MFTHCFSVTFSLLVSSSAIAFCDSAIATGLVPSQDYIQIPSAQSTGLKPSNLTALETEQIVTEIAALNGKPGVPRRRVGGGSRLR